MNKSIGFYAILFQDRQINLYIENIKSAHASEAIITSRMSQGRSQRKAVYFSCGIGVGPDWHAPRNHIFKLLK